MIPNQAELFQRAEVEGGSKTLENERKAESKMTILCFTGPAFDTLVNSMLITKDSSSR